MTELGLLPEEWEVARMGDYCNVHSGYAFKSQDFCEGGILVVKIGNLQNDTVVIDNRTSFFPSEKVSEYLRKFILEKDNVLIALTGATTGKIAVVPEKFEGALLNQRVGKIAVFNECLHSSFSRFYFTTKEFQEKIKENILQSAQGNVSPKQIENIRIPLPPLPEQQKIAKVLSTVQDAKEKTDAVITATKELKKSLMKHLFTYGHVSLEEAENVPRKETEIGLVPEEWDVKPLIAIATLQRGKDLPKQKQIRGLYPIVGSSGILGYHNEPACVGPGVVTGRSGSIGKLTYVEKDYWPHNTGLYVKNFHDNIPKFIYYLLHLLDFKKYATGVSVPTLNRNFIHSALLSLPPLLEQRRIASILSAVDEKIEKEETKKKSLEELFKTLLTILMTGKLRVNHLEV